jgi:D-proline reductase (dithiol) PrdB
MREGGPGPSSRESSLIMNKTVDSYRFLDRVNRMIVKAWIEREPSREIPWTPLSQPLPECTVALISSAAVALKEDEPFDMEGERRNPWWGDPSYRILPRDAKTADVTTYHLHINTRHPEEDLNCLMPLERLAELEEAGEIGRSAPSHYSFMGYLLRPQVFLDQYVPRIIESLRAEHVDVVVLVPV